MKRELKLFNGRLSGYEHGYIAAYSRADAVRIAGDVFGLRGWQGELRDYWNEGRWGNQMIGVTPRRGMFAQKKDGSLVEFTGLGGRGSTIPLERDDPLAWEAFMAKESADAEAAEAERERARDEKRKRARRLFQAIQINAIHTLLGIEGDYLTIDWEGHRYEIREID